MAGTVKHAKLERKPAARGSNAAGRRTGKRLVPGRVHLGFQCWKGDRHGRWLLRRNLGGGSTRPSPWAQRTTTRPPTAPPSSAMSRPMPRPAPWWIPRPPRFHRLTVEGAFNLYVEFKRAQGQAVADLLSRGPAHILPALGDLVVAELNAEVLRRWLATMAAGPAQTRPKDGKPQFKAEPAGKEAIRRRRRLPTAC